MNIATILNLARKIETRLCYTGTDVHLRLPFPKIWNRFKVTHISQTQKKVFWSSDFASQAVKYAIKRQTQKHFPLPPHVLHLPAIDQADSSIRHWPMTDVSTQKIPESRVSQLGAPQRSAQICGRVAVLKIKPAVKIRADGGIQGRSRRCRPFLGKARGVGF